MGYSVRFLRGALLLAFGLVAFLFLQDRSLWHGQHLADGQIQAFGGCSTLGKLLVLVFSFGHMISL